MAIIRVTVSNTYEYDTNESDFIRTEGDARQDVIDSMYTGEIDVLAFDVHVETVTA